MSDPHYIEKVNEVELIRSKRDNSIVGIIDEAGTKAIIGDRFDLWAEKPTAEEFGTGHAWFEDIGAISYSDSTSWQNPINSIAKINDCISVDTLYQSSGDIITSATNYHTTTDNHNLERLIVSGGIL